MKIFDASDGDFDSGYLVGKREDVPVFIIEAKRKYAYVKWDTYCCHYDLTDGAIEQIHDLWIALHKSWRKSKIWHKNKEVWLFNGKNCGSFEILISDIALVKPIMLSILEKDENYYDIRKR